MTKGDRNDEGEASPAIFPLTQSRKCLYKRQMLAELFTAENLTYYLIAVNFIAFAAFGLDKARAETGGWRISEGALLGWAFLGGTPGAYAGRQLFRHKTRKQPFSAELHLIAGFQAAALIFGTAIGWDTVGATIAKLAG